MSRTFVITGGAKGIGRCMVEYFASKGDKVYFIDNDAKTTIVVSNQLRGKGWDVHDFVGDIADKKTLIDFAAKVFQENPDGVHCLINNACLMRGGILKGCDYEDFLYIQQVGVVAPFMLSKLQRPLLWCGLNREYLFYQSLSVAAQHRELFGCKRRHHRFDARYGCASRV